MFRKSFFLLLSLMFVLTPVSVVLAAASSPADTYAQATESTVQFGTTDVNNLKVGCSNGAATTVTFLRWNLTGTNQPIGPSTKLVLNVSQVVTGSTGSVKLWKVAADTWDEATLTWNSQPVKGAEIASVALPPGSGSLTFTGQALADYINAETSYVDGTVDTTAGDDKVSFAVGLEGCSPFANVVFESKEKSGGTAPALNLFNPTAITLAYLSAVGATALPVVPVVVVLGLASLALVWIRRRKDAV